MRRPLLTLAALSCGLAIVLVAQRLDPIAGPPLYDGVIVEDEYKWLSPPPGYPGGAQPASASGAVQGGQNPNLSVGTPEQPPQAQVFAGQGFLVMPPGTATINVSIQPVPPAAQPTDGVIAGNVYRIALTTENGAALSGETSGGVTVVLRGPRGLPAATIERLAGGSWAPLQTDPAGVPHMFTAVVTDFGDFALVAPPGWAPDPPVPAQAPPAGPAAPQDTAGPQASTNGSAAAGSENTSGSGAPVLLIAGVAAALAFAVGTGLLLWILNRKPVAQSRRPVRPVAPPTGSAPVRRSRPPRRPRR